MRRAAVSPNNQAGWHWDHSYACLPEVLFERSSPVSVRHPQLVVLNGALAKELGLDADALEDPALFTGNAIPAGCQPIAMAYAGHQFGQFTMLGDGRAILLGEHLTPDGRRFDIQLKGAGQTAYSRRGDGRAALGPMLREYLISEAMHALGIPTTRSLAVASTGEDVFRTEILAGAVLTRVASSHIRVGTFEWAAAHGDLSVLRALTDYTRRRHFPELTDASTHELLVSIIDKQASLIARWLLVGFIHGVMNTDNMALSGETIDYGPCAFMDAYDPGTVFSSIDHRGRYAYDQQAGVGQWNLARLAEAMLPLMHDENHNAVASANEALESYGDRFHGYWLSGMRAKLGLCNEESGDESLATGLLGWMRAQRMDFTNTFRALSHPHAMSTAPFADATFTTWHRSWLERLKRQSASHQDAAQCMRAHNPAVIPRNHMVENALTAATRHGDLSAMQRLLDVLAHPHAEHAPQEFTTPPPADAPIYQTFCGT